MKIVISATAKNLVQAKKLLDLGVDQVLIGNKNYSLRYSNFFSNEELKAITEYAHKHQKQVNVAVNALMTEKMIEKVKQYLHFLAEINVDLITVSDPGIVFLLQENNLKLPFIYEASVFVTSARQVNFWAKRGAIGAVLARELTGEELFAEKDKFQIPVEIQVYGATVVQHSQRKLLSNYFDFLKISEETLQERNWFIIDPQDDSTHYSIYEDSQGTHVFANNDLNLLLELKKLANWGFKHWKLEGLYTSETAFIKIAALFVKARDLIYQDSFDLITATLLAENVRKLHPQNRGLDEGFFIKKAIDIK